MMTVPIRVVTVNEQNIHQHPQAICFINPKHPSYSLKTSWLKQRFSEGLVIKLLYVEGENRPVGFLEYVPGENCWRAVSAAGFLFIHCIWVNSSKYKNNGLGTVLLNECIDEADRRGLSGVAAMTSSGSFMADRSLFLKNGFTIADSSPPHHDLLVRQLRQGTAPRFNDWRGALNKYKGLHIVYSRQCPWVARFAGEMEALLKDTRISLTVTELTTPRQAQSAPSAYAVFNMVLNGKLVADHYISETRFKNILKREKLL